MTGVVLNIICVVCCGLSAVVNFIYGNTALGIFHLILTLIWVFIAVVNFRKLK